MSPQRRKRTVAVGVGAGLLALGLAGCSMHPLPEDVSRVSTFDIVERIRCEVADGLKEFERAPNRDKAEAIIGATTIGYDFDFEIEEKASALDGKLEFQRRAFNGDKTGFFLDLSGRAEGERKNFRSFRIVDKLSELSKERSERCTRTVRTANGVYPITGSTGMAEVVRTYVKLELLTDLQVTNTKGEVFSDVLEFTTKFTASVTPKIELVTVAGDFRLSKASFAGSASRQDIHSVTVALTRGPGDVDMVASLVSGLNFAKNAGEVEPFKGEPLIRPYRTMRRLIATQGSDAPTRVVNELQRRRDAREDRRAVSRILLGTD